MMKLLNNKTAKGLVSLITIILLLSSILATSIFYENNITANVVIDKIDSKSFISIKEVNNIEELNQLNEGWYEIRSGHVFYLDTFNSYAPLWIKVKNPKQQNGLFVVDEYGDIEFYDKDKKSIEKELIEEEIEVKSIATTITGKVTGLEKVSGFETIKVPKSEVTATGAPITTSTISKKQAYIVEISTNNYKMIIVEGNKITVVKDATLKSDNWEGTFDKGYNIQNLEALKGTLLQKWDGNDPKKVPIQGGTKDFSKCTSDPPCIYTDTFTDGSKTITSITGTSTTVEKFKTAYLDNGKEIAKQEYVKLNKEGKTGLDTKEIPTSKVVEETKDGIKYVTTYTYTVIYPIVTYEATKINQKTGQIEEFIYGEGGKQLIIKTPGGVGILDIFKSEYQMEGDTSLLPKASTRLNQLASRQFFAEVERVLTEFQGLSYLPTLFMDEDSLLAWRDKVDRIFATLYLGTEYWASAICGNYLDGEDEGIAYAETPQGLAQVAAHIEATRTEPIITENGTTQFIYKITFNVRNGDYDKDPRAPEEMNINVILKREKTVNVFKKEQKVKRGSTFGRTGSNAIVQDSSTFFNQVCLKFDKIPFRWKISDKEICNAIVESSTTPTTITTTTTTTTTGTAPESEINDF